MLVALRADGLWGVLALFVNPTNAKLLGICSPQALFVEGYVNAVGQLVCPSAPVATPLWNSGQAVTSADAPPPGACCTSPRYCQTVSHVCSATVKAAQQVKQTALLKASNTALSLIMGQISGKSKHSIH